MSVELDEIKIPVEDLEIGMYVSRLDRPWTETDFLLQGFLIESPETIDSLRAQCDFVYIETKSQFLHPSRARFERRSEKHGLFARKKQNARSTSRSSESGASKTDKASQKARKKTSYINKVPIETEFPEAKKSYGYAKLTAKNIMDGIRIGRTIDMNESRLVVNRVVDSIIRNSNALVWLTKLKNKDEYTAEHSLNVCILSAAFARHLGLDEDEIRKIGLCGLLHDVGKAKIPLEVLNKPGRFTDEEFEIMKMHPLYGRDLLMSLSDSDTAAIDVAYNHHERIDEMGYPRGLKSHQIPYYSRIIAITDTYDAITSSRCYDQGRSSMDALDIIYKNKGRQFDEELAIEFIKCIGIYPPGSIVEMSNGEVGIIIASNQESKLRPKIIMVLDADKKKQREKIVNLRDLPKDDSGNPYAIKAEIPNGKYGVRIQDFIKRGLVLEPANQ